MAEENFDIRQKMTDLVFGVQQDIVDAISAVDGSAFADDQWERDGGGGGRTRVLQQGNVFEKAGVGVSVVEGELSPEAAAQMGGGAHIEDLSFWATGVSLVIHPHNPMAPTVHANYRYFERGKCAPGKTRQPGTWWFGGGADLTPAYLFEEDARHFHQVHKDACDAYDPTFYPRYKKWCDEYFYIPHRKEGRGVGGIFFDNLHGPGSIEELFGFVSGCANAFLPAYLPIVERRKDLAYTEAQKRWQQMRRGRYVEFNLVEDRGTKFGLRTGGRTESILMSLPLTARWEYDPKMEEGGDEAALVEVLKSPRNWLG
ncbi:oxygen-dependent coproporphyrinogen oxidase [Bradymonas sediminis]|uniref:coproporphyrinogen oxidase n=1 Tax=Bradymonas sediminis TaxID=1548548 RepID=A0A2Z4FK13_9DELT|nr:oxygen-dependent coproporphyrinogen oxidase [Bradymonas sediminis]AWV89317.1 oxygen-dependent coproporphyrinogen oxidase [Bradymonas sediminis]TDP73491.1 coproporphyrinogen oxidase [Bradymonas sediminis]